MNTEKQLCINWTCKISTARCHVKSRHSQIRLTISCALTAIHWVSPHWQMFDGQITRVCILLAYLEREWPCTLAPTRNSMRFCVHFWCICHFHHRPTMAESALQSQVEPGRVTSAFAVKSTLIPRLWAKTLIPNRLQEGRRHWGTNAISTCDQWRWLQATFVGHTGTKIADGYFWVWKMRGLRVGSCVEDSYCTFWVRPDIYLCTGMVILRCYIAYGDL